MLAALLGALGAFWSASQQSNLRKKSEGNAVEQLRLLQDLSARGGDQKALEELIRARSRALNVDRKKADDIADDIIKRLPGQTAEFRALEQNKMDAYQQMAADFRLKWEPVIEAALNRFDSLTEQCQKKGIALQKLSVPFSEFPFTTNAGGQRGSYKIREIQLGDTKLHAEYQSFAITENINGYIYGNAQLTFYLAGKPALILSFGKDAGYSELIFPGESTKNSGEIEAPKDGNLPKNLITFFDDAFAKVFERFLIMGNADIEKRRARSR
jgi:hypothetical protein